MHAWYCRGCGEAGIWGPAPLIEDHGDSVEGDPVFVSSDDKTLHFIWRVGGGLLKQKEYVRDVSWSDKKDLARGESRTGDVRAALSEGPHAAG
jgi:hypothetical protein